MALNLEAASEPGLDYALLARTSTEDNQSPEESLKWQEHRGGLVIRDTGQIAVVFHDKGLSRSIPWKRRPEAQALLDEMRQPRPLRRFDAVVIGEPQRAFGDQLQIASIVPIFVHLGIPLWVPELGGPYDPANDAHDIVLGLFGGMSKAERNRIRLRVKSQMTVQAKEGRYLGGRPPYGYMLADAGPHPNPAKAADGKRLQRLVPDPVAAPVVKRIFDMYVRQDMGIKTIAQRLTDEGIPSPSGHDPTRNRHRANAKGAWARSAVRAILINPRYVGHQVWHKITGTEVLLDIDDVTLGSKKRARPTSADQIITSAEHAQEPLIEQATFDAVQDRLTGGVHAPVRRQRATPHPYVLRSLITCARCGRRMQGSWRQTRAYYQCRLADPAEYARSRALEADHPRSAYVREDRITRHIDTWLAELFNPGNIDQTIAQLTQPVTDDAPSPRAEVLRRTLAELDRKLDRYRDALEAGTNPALIAQWTAEVETSKAATQSELATLGAAPPKPIKNVPAIIASIRHEWGTMADALGAADGTRKAELLSSLGVLVSYDPLTHKAQVTCRPKVSESVVSEGGLEPPRP
jgi:site-specific DNA recombinase